MYSSTVSEQFPFPVYAKQSMTITRAITGKAPLGTPGEEWSLNIFTGEEWSPKQVLEKSGP